MSELFEELPEVGDPDKPKFVFFFDEAHLLFNGAPKALVEKVTQVVRLIRSKGVGVYFITQNPDDVPGEVLAQLGNRIQHALRAFTPRDAKALKEAASTFRPNPAFDTETAIREVGTGEAVVSLLEEKGVPAMVSRTLIRPPASRMGPITAEERAESLRASPVAGVYDAAVDREVGARTAWGAGGRGREGGGVGGGDARRGRCPGEGREGVQRGAALRAPSEQPSRSSAGSGRDAGEDDGQAAWHTAGAGDGAGHPGRALSVALRRPSIDWSGRRDWPGCGRGPAGGGAGGRGGQRP